jgi:hypothetical protein
MYYDVVVLPPKEIRENVGRQVRNESRAYTSKFLVDNRKLIPHLSLFHIRTSVANIKKVEATVKKLLDNYQPQVVRSCGIIVHSNNSISLNLSKPKELNFLHRKIVAQGKDFRTGEMPWTSKGRMPTKLEVLYRQRYGTQHLLKFFNPHLTLGMFIEADAAKIVARKLSKLRCTFVADTIAIAEVNRLHQVTRVIKILRVSTA